MTKRYDVIDKEEPRGQSVTYDGIPCTARYCCTALNRLTEEKGQLKADKQALIDFIKKEFPKSHKHILEGFE